MLNRQQCSSNPCKTIGAGGNGCMTNLQSIGIGDYELAPEAADSFIEMVENMPKNIRNSIQLVSAYRKAETQCSLLDWDNYERTGKFRKKGKLSVPVAPPGTSNHGWGRAIDIYPRNVQQWIKNNGSEYGWCWGEAKSEPWHFTFCGSGSNRWRGCDSICNVKSKSDKTTSDEKETESSVGLTQNFYKGTAASNIEILIGKMESRGITNPMVQAAILATVGKESGFLPQNEIGYGGTPNNSIRKHFSSTRKLSDAKLDQLKSNDEDFFNFVYGPKGAGPGLGNTQPGDGYKFRGRGFNQITGRGNYKAYGYENNPDKLNSVDGAAEAAIDFLAKEGSSLNNRFDNVDEAVEFFVTRNAGGRKKPGEESKARQVLQKFNIGKQSSKTGGGSKSVKSDTEKQKEKKIRLSPLGFLDPIVALARGEDDSSTLKEESERIKDIIRKIL
jgi:predicted chitinase